MAIELITGYAGMGHISSDDDASAYAAIVGQGRYVTCRGRKLEASIQSNNIIRIHDGDIFAQGRHIRIKTGTYEDVTIANGTQGQTRVDMIVARYSKNPSTGIESVSLVAIRGTTSATPSPTQGDTFGGALTDDTPLYAVTLSGVTIASVVPLFEVAPSLAEIKRMLDEKIERGPIVAWQWITSAVFNASSLNQGVSLTIPIPVRSGYTAHGLYGYTVNYDGTAGSYDYMFDVNNLAVDHGTNTVVAQLVNRFNGKNHATLGVGILYFRNT